MERRAGSLGIESPQVLRADTWTEIWPTRNTTFVCGYINMYTYKQLGVCGWEGRITLTVLAQCNIPRKESIQVYVELHRHLLAGTTEMQLRLQGRVSLCATNFRSVTWV